jgi:hypothetical protein
LYHRSGSRIDPIAVAATSTSSSLTALAEFQAYREKQSHGNAGVPPGTTMSPLPTNTDELSAGSLFETLSLKSASSPAAPDGGVSISVTTQ